MTNSPSSTGHARRSASIVSTGAYVPSRVLTNADLETMVDTTDEWILSRTGIRERRIAAEDEFTSDMGAKAAQQALELGGISPLSVDLILVATCTGDTIFPSTACYIQNKIGATRAAAFDLQAACAGFFVRPGHGGSVHRRWHLQHGSCDRCRKTFVHRELERSEHLRSFW